MLYSTDVDDAQCSWPMMLGVVGGLRLGAGLWMMLGVAKG